MSKPNDQLIAYFKTLQGIDVTADVTSQFQYFNISGFDHKGQVSAAYGAIGKEVNGTIDINILNFIGVLIPGLSLTVQGTGSLQLLQENQLICQVFPKNTYYGKVYASYAAPSVAEGGNILPVDIFSEVNTNHEKAHIVSSNLNPVTLFSFNGRSVKGTFGISINAGASLPIPSFTDALGLDLSVSLSAGANVKAKVIRLKALGPQFFVKQSDDILNQTSRLEYAVNAILNNPTKEDIKAEVDAWINDMTEAYLSNMIPEDRRRQKAKEFVKKIPFARVTEQVEGIINDYVLSKFDAKAKAPIFHQWLEEWQNSSSTKKLLQRLHAFHNKINELVNQNKNFEEGVLLLEQIDNYISLLSRFNERINSSDNLLEYVTDKLSYFRLFSFGGGTHGLAEANAEVTASIALPEEYSLDAAAKANFSSGVKSKVKFIKYRYQGINNSSSGPLVYTQDTWVSFRQTRLTAGVATSLSIPLYEFEFKKQKEGLYQSISYKSVGLYWIHNPERMQNPNGIANKITINALSGSGVSYGMSVSIKRLIDYARSLSGKNPYAVNGRKPFIFNKEYDGYQDKLFIKAIIRALKIPEPEFKTFINNARIEDWDDTDLPKYIFLEANYTYDIPRAINLRCGKFNPHNTTTGDFMPVQFPLYDPEGSFSNPEFFNNRNLSLEALRIRYRYSDAVKEKNPLFELGFKVLGTGFEFDLTNVEKAGQNAFIDLYTHWFNKPDYNEDPGLASYAQELSVQPVIMLHL